MDLLLLFTLTAFAGLVCVVLGSMSNGGKDNGKDFWRN